MAAIPTSEAFSDQHATHALAVHEHEAQQTTISIPIPVDQLDRNRSAIQKLLQPARRSVAKRLLVRTSRVMGLGCVDIGDPNLLAAEPNRVAIDHAVVAATREAKREVGSDPFTGPNHIVSARLLP
jgi:hypothetical protein